MKASGSSMLPGPRKISGIGSFRTTDIRCGTPYGEAVATVDQTTVDAVRIHLEEALESAENTATRHSIRNALQLLVQLEDENAES